MTPPASATAPARRPAGGEPSDRRSPATAGRRPPLEVVGPRTHRRRIRRRRIAPVVSAALVVASLLAVVAGHSVLVENQVRLSNVQSALSSAVAAENHYTLEVAEGEDPSRIVGEARRLGMVTPAGITQLPYVPLGSPLPPPSVAPSPSGAAGT